MLRFPAHVPRLARAAMLVLCLTAGAQSSAQVLSFRIDEGRNINSFVREGPVAAHLLLRSGLEPRIVVAFPAGNSGVGLWFTKAQKPVGWTLAESPRPITLADSKGRELHGIEALATIDADAIDIDRAVLSSVRVLRDYELLDTAPAEVLTSPVLDRKQLVWSRDRLDGAPGYRLSIEALDGAAISATSIKSSGSGPIRLKIQALTGETPLTPLSEASLLTPAAARDMRARNALTFLGYEEKLLAGSWRFNTYFGRDTLISLMLLAPVLRPDAMHSGLASVLARLAPNGEVAHEEDIGEFAVLRNMKDGRGQHDTPIYDYGMVDDDFLLAPVVAYWLLDSVAGGGGAKTFLSDRAAEASNGDALVRNLRWVVELTAAFADDPRLPNLVGIKKGRSTGQWRDSEEGLGRGRYAYDVNAVFVPAALRATDRLLKSGLLDRYLSAEERDVLTRADAQHRVWSKQAPPMFVVTLAADRARMHVNAYASEAGVDSTKPLASLDNKSLAFNALSLDAAGRQVPVMHSDDGFALLFGTPTLADLERSIETIMRPFPAGLLTSVGLLVANPAFADRETQARFTNTAYHGTVIWSWQQAVLAAGLERQLARTDLPPPLRARLVAARSQLWSAIEAAGALRSSELWSWSFANGRYRIEPFGQRGVDADESNAAQLWSTVFLASDPGQRRAD
jgi:glycogen debranching enzyme